MKRLFLFVTALTLSALFPQLAGLLAGAGVALAVAPISGVRGTAGATGGILSNARVVDMSDTIHLLDPNEAPLTALTMKLRTVSAISPKIEWMEDDYIPSSDTVNGTLTTVTITTITVDTLGPVFRVGDVIKHLKTGECMLVTSVPTTATIGVTRGVGSTAAAAIDDAETLLIIGNANTENSSKRTVFTAKKTALYNYTQIFRWEFGSSGTLQASELYGGDDLSYQQKKAGKEFRIQMERSYLWGEKAEDTTGALAIRYTDGIMARVTTNVSSIVTLTMATLEAFLRTGFRYGPARKILFASREVVSYMSLIAGTKIQTRPTDKNFPMALTEYVSPHGKLYIATHNLLAGSGGTTLNYGGYGLLVDLDSCFHRPLKGRNTMLRTNIQDNDQDGRIDGYLAECGLQVIQEKNHAIMDTVTTYT
jgi:hypothetical protein